ncbi:M14 family metallopeptidase [Filimonas effusa]|uniref:Zinc carboxypeptidase n=1 Tax=Filimonas effusa TaxID=2508721 RepID=A0A4Q1D596_9BACT|nr:M14 family metallopeptidase [Filimonas effusa]RXK82811.1 zinc carboxypeptidase [Filimonas effusa]
MRQIFLFSVLLCCFFTVHAQSVQSPEQFLGYKLGSRYTAHHQVVAYCRAVAAARPDMVKVESYGKTTENRELIVVYISDPSHIAKLGEIQRNNLRLAGSSKDAAATTQAPAVVWLSYNVHGNEPSSSEAAMQTLFALADPANKQTKEWLKQTVVIIDPCINPDGRDRYVNWFNSVVGRKYNVDPQSREHDEPWPGGRSNHYNFDLNRDWAWQTQVESQQRMKKYNEWMPQVHVDFHEQLYNSPYYFAPAAEPLHEVITPWQREFQVLSGKNNARYFDANGWLYFTREEFDLFYPSYGDTYPMYNGAIGMTFEQGGHSRGGLGIVKSDGDTLTLSDRIAHHYTAGLSTIEISAKNAARLVTEYKKFFDDNTAAKDAVYKTYVVTTKNKAQLEGLKRLLHANDIRYGQLASKSFRGLNYFSDKEESFRDEGEHLAITAFQPRSNLLRVLFEPRSRLNDSVTYDITAWAIPYVYNLKAYAVKERLEIQENRTGEPAPAADITSNYGLLIPYNSLQSAQAMAALLQQKVRLRFAQKPFTYKNKVYERGTLLVLKGGNIPEWSAVTNKVCRNFQLQPESVESGFVDQGADFGSSGIHYLHAPRVALLTGEQTSSLGAGEVWAFFDQVLDYPVTLLNTRDLADFSLRNYDVLIMPDGYYDVLNDKNVNDKLRTFVKEGGKLVAIEQAVARLSDEGWGIQPKEEEKDNDSVGSYSMLHRFSEQERDGAAEAIPGAIFRVDLDDSHPLAYGYSGSYYTLKQQSTVYNFLKNGWNVGVLKKENYVSGFVGSRLKPRIKDGLVFGAQGLGKGTVVYLADNPLFRHFWEGGKLLFANAVFLAGQ